MIKTNYAVSRISNVPSKLTPKGRLEAFTLLWKQSQSSAIIQILLHTVRYGLACQAFARQHSNALPLACTRITSLFNRDGNGRSKGSSSRNIWHSYNSDIRFDPSIFISTVMRIYQATFGNQSAENDLGEKKACKEWKLEWRNSPDAVVGGETSVEYST